MSEAELGAGWGTAGGHAKDHAADTIVPGPEFLVAADILTTITTPTQEEQINLAVVVVIRTIQGYFLSNEAAEFNLPG